MFLILFIVFIIFCLIYPFLRYILFHPISCGKLFFKETKDKIIHKRSNECKEYGKVFMFTASGTKAFGSGKTLSMVRWVTMLFNKYNGLPVWDDDKQEFVTQRVIIISNVELKKIPYIKFIGREQFVNIDKLEHTEHDIIVYCIDEAGMEFNSRQYKDNFSVDFLQRLLQVRHNKAILCLTCQRWTFCDKVLRQICSTVTTCKMWWRIVRLQEFDAFAMENLPNPAMLEPISTKFYLATDDLFNSYDTTYNVEILKKQLAEGDLLDTTEILERIGSYTDPTLSENRTKKRYRRSYREKR